MTFPHAEVTRWAQGYRARQMPPAPVPVTESVRRGLRRHWPLLAALAFAGVAVGAGIDMATGMTAASSSVGVALYGVAAAAFLLMHVRRVRVARRRRVPQLIEPQRAIDMPAAARQLLSQLPHLGPSLPPHAFQAAVTDVRALEPGLDEETARCLVQAAANPAS